MHNLHIEVGKAFDNLALNYNFVVLKDDACYSPVIHNPHLQFFITNIPKRETCVSKADIILLKGNELKLVCEIEESGFNPTKLFGKVISTATAKAAKVRKSTYNLQPNSNGIFIQIISSEKMNSSMKNSLNSKKVGQFNNISYEINEVLKKSNLWIKQYHIICGSPLDFVNKNSVYTTLEDIIKLL